MTKAEHKRLLVALCESDRLEFYLLRMKKQERESAPIPRFLAQAAPWLGLIPVLFKRRCGTASSLVSQVMDFARNFLRKSPEQ